MKTLFEQIDALEPAVTEADLRRLKADIYAAWKKDHPEEWRRIVKRYNNKKKREDKSDDKG